MRTALTARHLAGAALLLVLAGCASAGGGEPGPAGTTPVQAVRAEICAVVADGAVSPEEVEKLDKVLYRAHSLGLPKAILDPAHEIVMSDEPPKPAVAKLRIACG